MFRHSIVYVQLVEAQFRQGPLPMPHAPKLRGLKDCVRSLHRARLETSLSRAEAFNLNRSYTPCHAN